MFWYIMVGLVAIPSLIVAILFGYPLLIGSYNQYKINKLLKRLP